MEKVKEAKKTKLVIILIVLSLMFVLFYSFYINILADNLEYEKAYVPKPYDGNASAKVVLTEYSDFECPACAYAEPIIRALRSEYKDKIAFRYINFPLTNIHPNAFSAAEASECANDQGKFWEYHDKLFENNRNLNKDTYLKIAREIGLNMTSFEICINSGAKKEVVIKDIKEALEKNIRGTPSFFVNDKYIENYSYENLKKEIEEALKK
ncbi:MAG: thioredoxin domain-containing protein [Candidatus Woesearchaeota archaeon]